jgi:N-methylhydantoinase B/oxoprolinase/acetone carboxylase alpha subunit
MTKQYFHLQGVQYAYKIKYEDVNSLFLLQKPDGGRMSFVISLEKPIRQGSQVYHNLVLETHKIEASMDINLTQEEIDDEYNGTSSIYHIIVVIMIGFCLGVMIIIRSGLWFGIDASIRDLPF